MSLKELMSRRFGPSRERRPSAISVQLMQMSASLLEPIHDAHLDSVRASRVKAMDETPITAGAPCRVHLTFCRSCNRGSIYHILSSRREASVHPDPT